MIRKNLRRFVPGIVVFIYREYARDRAARKTVARYPHITTGRNVFIHGDCSFGAEVALGDNINLNSVSVGKYTSFSGNDGIRHCDIGSFCSIAQNVKINLGAHPSAMVSTHAAFFADRGYKGKRYTDASHTQSFEQFPRVSIGSDVWIGEGALIKEGLRIGDGAIIGAGAVVTKDVEPYAIVGGVPAKLIRYRFSPEQIAFLLKFKWWDKDDAWLKENWRDFSNINAFMAKHKNR